MIRPFLIFLFLFVFLYSSAQKNETAFTYDELNALLEIAKSSNDQKKIGEIYIMLGDYEGDVLLDYAKSLRNYQIALDYFKVANDAQGKIATNHLIAKRYQQAGLYSESMSLLNNVIRSLYKSDEINRLDSKLLQDLNYEEKKRLADAYIDLNIATKNLGEIAQSRKYLEFASEINEGIKDSLTSVRLLFEKIIYASTTYSLDEALQYAAKAFMYGKAIKSNDIIAQSLYYLGYINFLKKDYDKADRYLNYCLSVLPTVPLSSLKKDTYRELSSVYFSKGQLDQAYNYLSKFVVLKDSIDNHNKLESITNIAIKYGLREKNTNIEILKIEKEFEIEKNKAQRRTLYLLAGGFFLVLLSLYFIIKFYDQQISSTKIINEQREEISQQKIRELEDSFRIANMHAVIEGQEMERERIAKDLHDSLGGLLSTIKLKFDNVTAHNNFLNDQKDYLKAYNLLDNAVEEIRTISRNLQPGSLHELGLISSIKDLINRFEGEGQPDIDFQYYDFPEKLDKMLALTVYRIIQELLVNTIKHAKASEILVQLNGNNEEIIIQYEDDGIGFDPENLKRKGMGLENIKSRINYLKGSMSIDSEHGKGISVLIHLKNN